MLGPSVNAKQTVEQIYSIRVHHETEGNVTLMNIKRDSNLSDIRSHLEATDLLQGRDFEFLRRDSSIISEHDEHYERALGYIPVIVVRTVTEAEAEKASIIVCRYATGEEFLTTRVPIHYTFANLLDDAASFWDVPVECATLKDAEGFSWAENISVLKLLRSSNRPSTIFLHEDYTPTATGRGDGTQQWVYRKPDDAPRTSRKPDKSSTAGTVTPSGSLRLKDRQSRTQKNPILVSINDESVSQGQRRDPSSRKSRTTRNRAHAADGESAMQTQREASTFQDDGNESEEEPLNVDEKLFSVFTYHCVRGNSLHPDRMMFRQFKQFAKRCRMLSKDFSQAHLQVVYSSILMQGKVLGVSNDKMLYHHFVKALVCVAERLDMPGDTPAEKLLNLVDEYVAPRADDWNLEVWKNYRDTANTDEIRNTFQEIEEGLAMIFRYYADSQLHNDFMLVPMSYANFWRFIADFEIMTLKLSHQEVVGIYLAACSCPGIVPNKVGSPSTRHHPDESNDPELLPNAAGTAWTQMYFPNFLMFVAILGIHCYRHSAEPGTPPEIHLKAIMYVLRSFE